MVIDMGKGGGRDVKKLHAGIETTINLPDHLMLVTQYYFNHE